MEDQARSQPRPLIDTDLDSLRPLQLQLAQGEQAVAEWQEWVQRYHPRGCRKPLGAHLRYVLRDRQGRLLGCAQFEYASRKLACRDAWIGWQGEAFHRHLKLVVRHARYLPAVPGDDQGARGRPQRPRRSTPARCGRTSPSCCARGGRPRPRQQPPGPQEAGREERFTALWRDVIADVVHVATAYDREWIRRRRKVNTLLVVLFVFRLVFAPDRQGYAATLHQVWEQCRQLELPRWPRPSAQAALHGRSLRGPLPRRLQGPIRPPDGQGQGAQGGPRRRHAQAAHPRQRPAAGQPHLAAGASPLRGARMNLPNLLGLSRRSPPGCGPQARNPLLKSHFPRISA